MPIKRRRHPIAKFVIDDCREFFSDSTQSDSSGFNSDNIVEPSTSSTNDSKARVLGCQKTGMLVLKRATAKDSHKALKKECDMVKDIEHPHIVMVLGWIFNKTRSCIVMELAKVPEILNE